MKLMRSLRCTIELLFVDPWKDSQREDGGKPGMSVLLRVVCRYFGTTGKDSLWVFRSIADPACREQDSVTTGEHIKKAHPNPDAPLRLLDGGGVPQDPVGITS
jgi:hypothetical protein